MGQREFAAGKNRDQVELKQLLKIFDRELIYRMSRRVPAGVVDEPIKAAMLFNRRVNHSLDLFRKPNVTLFKMTSPRFYLTETGGELLSGFAINIADDNVCSGPDEGSRTPFPDTLGTAGYNGDFSKLFHVPKPPTKIEEAARTLVLLTDLNALKARVPGLRARQNEIAITELGLNVLLTCRQGSLGQVTSLNTSFRHAVMEMPDIVHLQADFPNRSFPTPLQRPDSRTQLRLNKLEKLFPCGTDRYHCCA
jgi:hypothetical protein